MTSKETVEEAARRWPPGGTGLPFPEYYGFIAGAEWMGAQVASALFDQAGCDCDSAYLHQNWSAPHHASGCPVYERWESFERTLEGSGND